MENKEVQEENYVMENTQNYSKSDLEFFGNENLTSKDLELINKVKNKLSKEFDLKNNGNSNLDYNDLKDKIILNKNNCMALKFKNYFGFQILKDFFGENEIQESWHKAPNLQFKTKGLNEILSGFYSLEYFKFSCDLLNLFKKTQKNSLGFKITMRNDYPCIIENKYLMIIIAPRGIEEY